MRKAYSVHVIDAEYRHHEIQCGSLPEANERRWDEQDKGNVANVSVDGQCGCGTWISLDAFTNTCRCGREYNQMGQQLASRSQWGADTGETLSDIYSDYDPEEVA